MTERMFGPSPPASPKPGRPRATAKSRCSTSAAPPSTRPKTATAVRQAAILVGRHYAGRPCTELNTRGRQQLTMVFEDLTDYIFADPKATARATVWNGLKKASARWRHANSLRTMRENLLEEAKLKSEALSGWQTPITGVELDPGSKARALTSSNELIRESVNLDKCAAGAGYAHQCAAGQTRIIHIHPQRGSKRLKAPDQCGATREVTDELREILSRKPEQNPPQLGLNREAVWKESLSVWRNRGSKGATTRRKSRPGSIPRPDHTGCHHVPQAQRRNPVPQLENRNRLPAPGRLDPAAATARKGTGPNWFRQEEPRPPVTGIPLVSYPVPPRHCPSNARA